MGLCSLNAGHHLTPSHRSSSPARAVAMLPLRILQRVPRGLLFVGGCGGWAAITFSGLPPPAHPLPLAAPAGPCLPLFRLAESLARLQRSPQPHSCSTTSPFNISNDPARRPPNPGVGQAWDVINWVGMKKTSQPFPIRRDSPRPPSSPRLAAG
jgi:hypothetical protein